MRIRTAGIATLVTLAQLTLHSVAQSASPSAGDLRTQLQQRLPEWLKANNVPSAAVAYIADGKVAWTVVSGEQSPGIPATGQTLYNIASLTKPITAETILRLASKNQLTLDEPISPYWVDPDIKDNPWTKELTPRLCLTHQTGFANWRRMTNKVLTFKFEPGTQTGYSGEGYFYVARFTQNKLQKPFDQLAQENVFGPIGMKDTAYTTQPWFTGRIAAPYGHLPSGQDGYFEPQLTSTWNAADLVRTTVGDYAKFVVSVMHNDGVTPELAKQRLTMSRNWVPAKDSEALCKLEASNTPCHFSAGMGLGWQVFDHNGVTIVDHSGSDSGFHTLAFFVPGKQIGAVIFTNGDNGPKVIGEIVRVLYPDPLYDETTAH
ncbi:CubicO group peptidase, beta-lactamase class C family [Bryocella elongata]|uniref:CubicO group peptidase, beta-lactamase class C family n=1 Tax=Bryocella elongata TaxID=863522 RepID=A0A1H6BXX8_9BACT|nr:serine hydrolase domain-containing protein [Bryocella elongata]SEG65550.1 CubicO group peptidase, beta-lactamase class C family [Bryocella elongata]